MKRVDRESEIFEVLQEFKDEGLEFVVIGGYGIFLCTTQLSQV